MLDPQHLGGLFTGLAALFAAVTTPVVTLVVQARQMRKQEARVKDHLEAQVRKANGVPFAFIDNMPVPAWCKGIDGKMLWINFEYSQQWGIRPRDYEGRYDYDIWPAEIANAFRDHDVRVQTDRVTMATTEEIPETPNQPNSPMRTWNVRKFPVFNTNNDVIAIGGIAWLHGEEFTEVQDETAAVLVQ